MQHFTQTKAQRAFVRALAPLAVVVAFLVFTVPSWGQPTLILLDPAGNAQTTWFGTGNGDPIPTMICGGFRVTGGHFVFSDNPGSIGVGVSDLVVERLPGAPGIRLEVAVEGQFVNSVDGAAGGDVATVVTPLPLQPPLVVQAFHAYYNTQTLIGSFSSLPANGAFYSIPEVAASDASQLRVEVSVDLLNPVDEVEIDYASATVVEQAIEIGDVNFDGTVNIADVIKLLEYLYPAMPGSSPALPCEDAADTNRDGVLNIADAIRLLDALFGSGSELDIESGSGGLGCGLGYITMGGG